MTSGPQPMPYAAPSPFVPTYREPWFNPAKRTPLIIAAVIAAVVLLGIGGVIGGFIGHDGGRHSTFFRPAGNERQFPGGRGGGAAGGGAGQFPGGGQFPAGRLPAASSVPSAVPAPSSSS